MSRLVPVVVGLALALGNLCDTVQSAPISYHLRMRGFEYLPNPNPPELRPWSANVDITLTWDFRERRVSHNDWIR
jgi:hypothetical protein